MVSPQFKKFELMVTGTDRFYVKSGEEKYLDFSGSGMTTGYDFFKTLDISPVSSLVFKNRYTETFTEMLRRASGFEKIAYTTSGTEACDMALSRYGPPIVSLEGAYHGRTYLTYLVSNGLGIDYDNRIVHLRIPKSPDEEHSVKEYNESIMEKAAGSWDFNGKPLIMELIQSDGGVIVLSEEFIRHLKALSGKYGLRIIVDEVYTGFGRSGEMFLFRKHDLVPDMVCIGKGMAAGLPIGGVLYNGSWDRPFGNVLGMQGGNAACASVGINVMKALTEDQLINVREMGMLAITRLRKIRNQRILEVRGRGFMIGVDLSGGGDEGTEYAYDVRERLSREGVICSLVGEKNNVLKITPPVLIDEMTFLHGLAKIEKVLTEI